MKKTTLQSGYFENICCSAFLKAAVLESVFSCVTGCRHDIHLNAEQVRKGQENWEFRETFRGELCFKRPQLTHCN